MTRTKAAITAWSTFGLGCVMFATALGLSIASNPYRPAADRVGAGDVIWALSVLSIPLVGPFLATRQPRNPIGWLLCALGVGLSTGLAGSEYANHASSVPGSTLAAPEWAAWFANIPFAVSWTALGLTFLLIPDGSLPARRWRWVAGFVVTAAAIGLIGDLFAPGRFQPDYPINPLGVEGAGFLHPVSEIAFGVFGIGVLLAAASTLVRFKRATSEVRQQLKWFAFGTGAFILMMTALALLEALTTGSELEALGTLIFTLGMLALAGGLAISVLRYRLYDIDLVVNRTIVYLLLSVLLALIYFGGVAVLQGLIGFGGNSDLAVAASTLAVAGLFQPARGRIQGFIDHYFYRRKYDAQQTIDDFSSRLRDEIDLDSLNAELIGVVTQTMQPTHVSAWLPRPETT